MKSHSINSSKNISIKSSTNITVHITVIFTLNYDYCYYYCYYYSCYYYYYYSHSCDCHYYMNYCSTTLIITWTSKTVLLLSLQPLLVALLFTLLSPEVALQPGPFCLAQPLAGKRRCRLPHTGREQRGAAERLAWRAREVAMDFLGKKGEKNGGFTTRN